MLSLTQKQVAALVDLSANTLQEWVRSGLIIPSIQESTGRGSTRLYSPTDVVMVRTIMLVSDRSWNRQVVKNLCEWLHKKAGPPIHASLKEYLLDPADQSPIFLILTDDKWEFNRGKTAKDTALGQDYLVKLVINVAKIKQEVREKLTA